MLLLLLRLPSIHWFLYVLSVLLWSCCCHAQSKQRWHLQSPSRCRRSLRGARRTPACHKLFRRRGSAPASNQLRGLHRAALGRRHADTDNPITHNAHQKRGSGAAADFSGCFLSEILQRIKSWCLLQSVQIKSKWNWLVRTAVHLSTSSYKSKHFPSLIPFFFFFFLFTTVSHL